MKIYAAATCLIMALSMCSISSADAAPALRDNGKDDNDNASRGVKGGSRSRTYNAPTVARKLEEVEPLLHNSPSAISFPTFPGKPMIPTIPGKPMIPTIGRPPINLPPSRVILRTLLRIFSRGENFRDFLCELLFDNFGGNIKGLGDVLPEDLSAKMSTGVEIMKPFTPDSQMLHVFDDGSMCAMSATGECGEDFDIVFDNAMLSDGKGVDGFLIRYVGEAMLRIVNADGEVMSMPLSPSGEGPELISAITKTNTPIRRIMFERMSPLFRLVRMEIGRLCSARSSKSSKSGKGSSKGSRDSRDFKGCPGYENDDEWRPKIPIEVLEEVDDGVEKTEIAAASTNSTETKAKEVAQSSGSNNTEVSGGN